MLRFLLLMSLWTSQAVYANPTPLAPTAFSETYDATEAKGRRKAPTTRTSSEDTVLDKTSRAKITSSGRDIARNFAIAKWMIGKHLDYVATFDFHARTNDEAFNEELEKKMRTWRRPTNCDVAGRHSFSRMTRLSETRAVVDGDLGLMKLRSGHLQPIESDRVRNPAQRGKDETWVHGVRINEAGGALAYAVHKRKGATGWELDRIIPAASMCWHGYYERFDQVRGISPLASALNPLRDVYENFDYALIKAKVSQLFALAITHASDDSMGAISTTDGEDVEPKRKKYSVGVRSPSRRAMLTRFQNRGP